MGPGQNGTKRDGDEDTLGKMGRKGTEMGIQRDWGTMGRRHNATGALLDGKGRGWNTVGLEHNEMERDGDRDTVGLGHNETEAQWKERDGDGMQ